MPWDHILSKKEIEETINDINKGYMGEDGAILLKTNLDKLRRSFFKLSSEQKDKVSEMISYHLKPLDDLEKLKAQELDSGLFSYQEENRIRTEMFRAQGLYASLIGNRGSIKYEQSRESNRSLTSKVRQLLKSASDHKFSADKVTNRKNKYSFCFYQRLNSSNDFHGGLKLYWDNSDSIKPIEPKEIYNINKESFFNNKGLFFLIEKYANRFSLAPKKLTKEQNANLVGKTAISIMSNASYMFHNIYLDSNEDKTSWGLELLEEQIKYANKAQEIGITQISFQATIELKKVIAAQELSKGGLLTEREVLEFAEDLKTTLNKIPESEKAKYYYSHRKAIKTIKDYC